MTSTALWQEDKALIDHLSHRKFNAIVSYWSKLGQITVIAIRIPLNFGNMYFLNVQPFAIQHDLGLDWQIGDWRETCMSELMRLWFLVGMSR